ncbi:MAG TPA: FimV/HubP family polar landmark protein, partial [Candidatus Competibacteraceae bacterium]|nr:FimV/HubP family polar landmark protein [Candidatus Competibacteraceae bacterium]
APNPPPSEPPPPPVAHRGTATYGPVPFGETLWAIASRVRPDPTVSVPQMMRALLVANPKAFWKHHVDGLRAGAQLRIPSAQEIDPQRFSEEVSRQLASRQQVPVAPVIPSSVSPPESKPKVKLVSPDLEEKPQQPPPVALAAPSEAVAPAPAGASSFPIKLKDNQPALRVAGLEELRRRMNTPRPGEGSTAATQPPALAAIPAAETRQPRPEAQLPSASNTSSQLEPRLQEVLPETIAPRGTPNDTGAELKLAATATPAAPIPPAETSPPPPPKVIPPAPAILATPVPSPIPPPASRIPTKPFPVAAESETDGILSGWLNPASLALLGGLGFLFGGSFWWWQRRTRTEADKEEALAFEDIIPVETTAMAGTTDKPSLEARKEAVPVAGRRVARAVPNSLERADLLLAVGNYSEAKNLLHQALQEEPDNNVLRAKLLNVHFANQDAKAFLQEAKVLYESLGDEADPLWLSVVQQGQKLCPGHELFSRGDELLIATKTIKADFNELERPAKANGIPADNPAGEQGDTTLFNALNEPTLVFDKQKGDIPAGNPTDEQGDTTLFNALNEPTLISDADKGDNLAGLDWQLTDVDKPTLPAGFLAEPPTKPRTLPEEGSAEVDRLSLIPDPLTEPPTLPRTRPEPASTGGDKDGLPLPGGFLSEPITQPKTGVEKTRIEQELQWRLKDLEQPELNTLPSPEHTEEQETPMATPSSGLDFEVDSGFARKVTNSRLPFVTAKGETERKTRTLKPVQQPTQGLRQSPQDRENTLVNRIEELATRGSVRVLMGEGYTETKLDLAMAYLEMGDSVGARSLLEEVVQEGNEDQQRRAREYLEKISQL